VMDGTSMAVSQNVGHSWARVSANSDVQLHI
jgi:hypothetical protein